MMGILNSKEYDCLVNALTTYERELEERVKDRMIETKIYFAEEDEQLAKIQDKKKTAEDLKKKLIKEWRLVLSE